MDEFEQFEGGVAVYLPDGSTRNIATPDGYTDTAFRGTLAAFHTAYLRNGAIPSVGDVHELWPKLPKKTISGVMSTLEFREAINTEESNGTPKTASPWNNKPSYSNYPTHSTDAASHPN
jgi:hypothetical protein